MQSRAEGCLWVQRLPSWPNTSNPVRGKGKRRNCPHDIPLLHSSTHSRLGSCTCLVIRGNCKTWTLDWTGLDCTILDLHNSRAERRDNRTRKYLLKLHYLKITTMHKSNINFKFHRCTYMYYLISLTTKQFATFASRIG